MRVSVIIANRNDVEKLAITVRSCLEDLTAVPGGGEVIVVDNSDKEIYEVMEAILPVGYRRAQKIRLFRQDFPCLFTAREEAARQARGDYLFCLDSHCLIGHNTIVDCVHFMNRNKDKKIGFAHPPINWLCQHERASRHDMRLIYGTWGKHYSYETKISWKGMPWMCRRDWFLNDLQGYGALAQHRLAWGGGDMHLGLKSWVLGYENWAVPTRPVIHIGPLPVVARKYCKYRHYSQSGEHFPWIGSLVSILALHGDELLKDEGFRSFMEDRNCVNIKEHYALAMDIAKDERQRIENDRRRTFESLMQNPPWAVGGYDSALSRYTDIFGPNPKAIKKQDWEILRQTIDTYGVKTAIEFGAGLSTMLFEEMGIKTTSYETEQLYIKKLQPLLRTKVYQWDNKKDLKPKKVDLAFIDGELPRDKQAEIARQVADIVIVHDGHKRQCGHKASSYFADWEEVPNETRLSRIFVRK